MEIDELELKKVMNMVELTGKRGTYLKSGLKPLNLPTTIVP